MRKKLAELLDSSGVFAAYLWERGGASSLLAKDAYIGDLNDSDLCVVVIDNADGVPHGVQVEVDHILQVKKRALFYFCTEFSNDKTSVQRMLDGPEGYTYKTVERMDQVPERVFRDLQEDVLVLYRRWCNHDVEPSGVLRENMPVVSTAQLPKTALSSLVGLREVIGKLVFGGEAEHEPLEGLDAEAAKLAKALYSDMNIDEYDPDSLISVAQNLLPEPYALVVKQRWRGNCWYLKGRVAEALSILEEAMEIAKSVGLEPWFVNDILIDLRNISSENSDALVIESKYQKQLTDNNGEVVYPLLDRAVSDSLESIEQDRIKEGLQSYTSYTIGDNALRFIDPICKAFAIAACFGSLTHIAITVKRLRHLVFYLCTKYQDANLNASLLKLSIICGKRGDADKTIQSFNNLRFDSDSESAEKVFNFCARYHCLNDSGIAVFEAFGVTGYYLSAADFARAAAVFVQRAEQALIGSDPWEPKPVSVFDAMRRNANRLSLPWMVDFAQRAIESSRYFWQNEALRFISRAQIDFGDIENSQLERLLNAIEELAGSTVDSVPRDCICDIAIAISEDADQKLCDQLNRIVALLPEFLQSHYRSVAGNACNDASMAYLVDRDITCILKENETQGKNEVFFGGLNHHVIAARRIEHMDNPSLDLGRRLYSASLGTLVSEDYDCTGKVHACEAMCRLLHLFGNDVIDDARTKELLLFDRESLLMAHSIGKESKLLLSVWINVLSFLVGVPCESSIISSIALCYKADVYTQANAGDAIAFLVRTDSAPCVPTSLQGFLFAYSCYLAKSLHFQLDIRGLKLLSAFLSNNTFRLTAAQALCDGYAGQSPRGKQIIIDTIPLIREFDDDMADGLRARVLRDSTTIAVSYLKKKEAEQTIIETKTESA